MTRPPRRAFLLGLGGSALVTGLAACSPSGSGRGPDGPVASPSSSAGGGSRYTGDLKLVAVAASLENLTVEAYTIVRAAARRGRYGSLSPAFDAFIDATTGHHAQHATAWNAMLIGAGLPAITGSPLTVSKSHLAAVRAAASMTEVTALALALEEIAAQTYTSAVGSMTEHACIVTAASIQPVESMHAATLRFLQGTSPAPAATIATDDAMQPGALTA